MKTITKVLTLTAAVAFSMAPVIATANSSSKILCSGINSCKGKGSCKTATNSCKGTNTCKGKGMVQTTEKKCLKKGGTVVPATS